MSDRLIALAVLVVLIALLSMYLRVALALTSQAFLALVLVANAPAGTVMATIFWRHSHGRSLTSLPLFLLTGDVLLGSPLPSGRFSRLAPRLGCAPGRLLHVDVFGSAIFAGVSGSSAATAGPLGRSSVPKLTKRGYPPSLILSPLAGSATPGLLIPRSIILTSNDVATERSTLRLFAADILPGLLPVAMFAG